MFTKKQQTAQINNLLCAQLHWDNNTVTKKFDTYKVHKDYFKVVVNLKRFLDRLRHLTHYSKTEFQKGEFFVYDA